MRDRNHDYAIRLRGRVGGVVTGVMVMLVGAILLLDQGHVVHFRHAWRLWPLFLIVIGIGGAFDGRRRSVFSSLFMTSLGFLFLAMNFNLWDLRWRQLPPLVILLVGGSLILDAFLRRFRSDDGPPPPPTPGGIES